MSQNKNPIHITAILGSVRPDNLTEKALSIVINELESYDGISTTLVNPGTMNLPLPGLPENDDARKLKESVVNTTGIILATPEYHGGFSSVIKVGY